MGDGTAPQGALRAHGSFPSEIAQFMETFGTGALISLSVERRHAIEILLTGLAGVRSAHVETTESGDIARIHVVSDGKLAPTQQARNVHSALLAALDLEVDPGLISVVPLKEDDDLRQEIGVPAARDPRVRLNHIGYEQDGFRITARLELEWQGHAFRGSSRDADTAKGRMMAAGRAALDALEEVTDRRVAFFLDGLEMLQTSDRSIAVASVRVISEARRADLAGCTIVTDDPNYAGAQAVLAAVNRCFGRLSGVRTNGEKTCSGPAPNGHVREGAS